jgi:hypothetical protein
MRSLDAFRVLGGGIIKINLSFGKVWMSNLFAGEVTLFFIDRVSIDRVEDAKDQLGRVPFLVEGGAIQGGAILLVALEVPGAQTKVAAATGS